MQDKIDSDLKAALLAGDKQKTETLRGLKAALLNEAIAAGARDTGLSDEQIQKVLAREAKKRSEAAEMYDSAGETERAAKENAEKATIEVYLPEQLGEAAIAAAVDQQIAALGATSPADMGKVIGAVKAKLGSAADGATIAKLVKEKLV
jgi:uncharacterized protein